MIDNELRTWLGRFLVSESPHFDRLLSPFISSFDVERLKISYVSAKKKKSIPNIILQYTYLY